MTWRRACVLAWLALALVGCGLFDGSRPTYSPSAGRYDALTDFERSEAVRARRLMDRGSWPAARRVLARLVRERPAHVGLGILAQEAALRDPDGPDPAGLLARARELADTNPTPAYELLAARLEDDPARARERIERAGALDPEFAWAFYALAHLHARAGEWERAEAQVARALELDPGHLSARRFEAGLLARAGKNDEAIRALERWLEVTEGDPIVLPEARLMASLDLAQLLLLSGEVKAARERLLALTDEPGDTARRLVLLAAAEQALGASDRALAAASAAEALDPDDPLPVVQQAMLHEEWLGDPAEARAAWERVLEVTGRQGELGALLLGMRAKVALERGAAGSPDPGAGRP